MFFNSKISLEVIFGTVLQNRKPQCPALSKNISNWLNCTANVQCTNCTYVYVCVCVCVCVCEMAFFIFFISICKGLNNTISTVPVILYVAFK